MNEKYEILKTLKIEDYVWYIYIGIVILCLYSNTVERHYVLYNDNYSKEKYRKMVIFIFSVAVIIYSYFFIDGYKNVKNLKPSDSKKKKDLNELSLIASTLILISGLIYLYIAIVDTDLDVELAFS